MFGASIDASYTMKLDVRVIRSYPTKELLEIKSNNLRLDRFLCVCCASRIIETFVKLLVLNDWTSSFIDDSDCIVSL